MVVSGAMLVWPLVQRRLSPVKDVGTLEATRLINSSNAVLLDVRETQEYEGGRLPKASHIPLSQLESRERRAREAQGPAGRRLLHDGQSQQPRRRRCWSEPGFKDVYQLRGGYRAWKDAGLPIEK